MKVKIESEVTQSCLTLSDPMDCSLPGFSVHGIFQARVLEVGAIAFSADKGDTGSVRGLGGFYMLQSNYARVPAIKPVFQQLSLELSPCSRALESQLLSQSAYSLCSTTREATEMRSPST